MREQKKTLSLPLKLYLSIKAYIVSNRQTDRQKDRYMIGKKKNPVHTNHSSKALILTLTQQTHTQTERERPTDTHASVDSETRFSFMSPHVLHHNSEFWQLSLQRLICSFSGNKIRSRVFYSVTPARAAFTKALFRLSAFCGFAFQWLRPCLSSGSRVLVEIWEHVG